MPALKLWNWKNGFKAMALVLLMFGLASAVVASGGGIAGDDVAKAWAGQPFRRATAQYAVAGPRYDRAELARVGL